jgi:hypothetical protein
VRTLLIRPKLSRSGFATRRKSEGCCWAPPVDPQASAPAHLPQVGGDRFPKNQNQATTSVRQENSKPIRRSISQSCLFYG